MATGIRAISYEVGSCFITNEVLGQQNPSWPMDEIQKRSGVSARPIAAPGETAFDLGLAAANRLMSDINLSPLDISALIFCTQTPDYIMPPNSMLLHGALNLPHNVMSFDICHACSGYIYGLGIGKSLIDSGIAKNVLLVNADTYSRLLNPNDRSARPIFGDGAAATLLSFSDLEFEIIGMNFFSSGQNYDRFIIKNGGARNPNKNSIDSDDFIKMNGFGVLSFFTNVVPPSINELLSQSNISLADISYFVFHQASQLALDGLQKSLEIPPNKVVNYLGGMGNLVSASIPIALKMLMDGSNNPKKGDLILLSGFGVGLSWGNVLIKVM